MYQSGRAGEEAKKRKSPAKSRRVGITALREAIILDDNTLKNGFWLTIGANNLKKISYYLSRVTSNTYFQIKFTSC